MPAALEKDFRFSLEISDAFMSLHPAGHFGANAQKQATFFERPKNRQLLGQLINWKELDWASQR